MLELVKLRGAFGFAGRAPGRSTRCAPGARATTAAGPSPSVPRIEGTTSWVGRTSEIEAGFDGSWLSGRLSGDLTYFRQTDRRALRARGAQQRRGWGDQLHNIGKIKNQGLEINTNATLVDTRAFRWELGLGIATNRSTVLDTGGAPPFSVGSSGYVFEGQPLPVIYDYHRILNPERIPNSPATKTEIQDFFGPANPLS